jgi:hypothetical protein
MSPYPEPSTPLPWTHAPGTPRDFTYMLHAANAFPALVAALETAVQFIDPDYFDGVVAIACIDAALDIARGEVTS